MPITLKKYQCLVCKNIEMHSTNHFGEIYCKCKNCKNTGLACIEPEATEAAKDNPTIATKLHKYRFDISNEEEKKQYYDLRQSLKNRGYKLFDSISGVSHEYFEMLPEEIQIDTSYVFDNQWNSSAGRVFDWKEEIYPNKKIKEGYWLELTKEHAKAREPKTYNCKTTYKNGILGEDTVKAINTGEASNIVFSKYFKEGMDILQYNTEITLIN